MGLVSAWACMIAHNMMLFVAFVIYYFAGRWDPQKTKESIKPSTINSKG
jgi:hypothetical protein